jgi:hypothetical protein
VARVVSAAAGEPLGSAAEEAARLVESLQGWFGVPVSVPTGEPADEGQPGKAPDAEADPHEHAAARHGPACRACPLCRGIAAVQQSHPEVLTHLAGAAQHLVAALRSLAAEPARAAGAPASADRPASERATSGGPTSGDRPAGRPSRAVRIDVEPDRDQARDEIPGQDAPGSGPSEQEPAP